MNQYEKFPGNGRHINRHTINSTSIAPYDYERSTRYELEAYSAEDVAENGEHAKVYRNTFFNEHPSLDMIAARCKEHGLDTFEIIKVVEETNRYYVNK